MTRAGIHKRWIEDENRAKKKDLIHKVVIATLAFIGIIGIVTFTPNPFAFEEQQSIDISLDYHQANEQQSNERSTLMEEDYEKMDLSGEDYSAPHWLELRKELQARHAYNIGTVYGPEKQEEKVRYLLDKFGCKEEDEEKRQMFINEYEKGAREYDERITLSEEEKERRLMQWQQIMDKLTDKAYWIGRNLKEHDGRQEIEKMAERNHVKNQEDKHDWYHLLLTWFKGRAFYCGQTYGASKEKKEEQIGLLLWHIGLKVNCNNYWEKHLIKQKLSKYYQYGVDAKELVDMAFLYGTKNIHEEYSHNKESENYYVKRLLKEGIDKNYWQKKSDLYEEMETKLRAAYQDGNKARK